MNLAAYEYKRQLATKARLYLSWTKERWVDHQLKAENLLEEDLLQIQEIADEVWKDSLK